MLIHENGDHELLGESTAAQVRDLWWHWHVLRTVAGLVALGLVIAASLRPIGVDCDRVRPAD